MKRKEKDVLVGLFAIGTLKQLRKNRLIKVS